MQDNKEFGLTEAQAKRVLIALRYRRLHQLAYDYPATQVQIDTAVETYYTMTMDVTLHLEEMLDETVGLAEVCGFTDIPDWMVAAAPNPTTYNRWLTTGRI
jgi:hypothetical protein